MMRSSRHPRGFTLIELLMALALASLLALAGAAALSVAIDFHQRQSARSQGREDVRAAERILRHEWASRGRTVRADGQFLEFDTVNPVLAGMAPAPAVAQVRYACETSPQGERTLTHRVSRARSADTTPDQRPDIVETQVLASGLRLCAFSFLMQPSAQQGRDTTSRWVARWDDKARPPVLMRLALSALREDMPPVVYLSLAVQDRP